MSKYDSFRVTVKYEITPHTPKSLLKKFTFFSSNIRMSGKNVNFGNKKIKKSDLYKNKRVTSIDEIDVNKI